MKDTPRRWQFSLRRLAAYVVLACVVLAILRQVTLVDGLGPVLAAYIACSAVAVRSC